VEDSIERAWPAFEPTNGTRTFHPFQIAGRLPLAPGTYKFEVVIAQKQAARSFRGQQTLVAGGGGGISISGPLLVTGIAHPPNPDAATPFQYFGTQFQPAARHILAARYPLRVLYQLESAGEAQDLEVEYLIANSQNRDARQTVTDKLSAAQFRSGRLMTSKALPILGLPDGDYRVVLTVRKAGNAESLASVNVALRLDSEGTDASLYFDPNTKRMNQPGVAAYIRALCAFSQGGTDLGTRYLRESVEQNPANTQAAAQLLRAWFDAKRYSEIALIYGKVGERPFENSAESLAQLSLGLWSAGQQEGARAVLSDAQQTFPGDPLVAAVGKTVH
jgi:hypothetical protein